MATLILGTLGGAIGGPIGAAIGASLGNSFDRAVLFKPKGRQGPRLTELAVQTSHYGQPIPRLYGTMRVAGSVIWATDLSETRSRSSSGKGQPSVTNYSYSASFAVLLSARPVQAVGRIWADGKLLRGAAGDFKAGTGFRLHLGAEDQLPDPLIAAAEGGGATPAMRGQAYAVFENLQLADFGNRIPSLTFEVIADGGPVAVGAIAADLGIAADDPGSALHGFSAYGDSLRGVLETLAEADGAWFAVAGDTIRLRAGPGPATTVGDAGVTVATGTGDGARDGARQVRAFTSRDSVPRRIAVAHYDPERDYQTGLQRARRPGPGDREARLDLPAALSASAARTLAEAALIRAETGRERRTLRLASDALTVAPGERVRIAGEPGLWRVARCVLERMAVRLELVRIGAAPAAVAAAPGRVSAAPDHVHGPTILHAFEIPSVDDIPLTTPRATIAAAGGIGWRQAALLVSLDGGARWTAAGAANVPATLGTVVSPPGPAGPALRDRRNAVEVELAHAGMVLADADATAIDMGGNLALIGDELVQFGRAERIGLRRWRLSELLRGRRGTEAAAGMQAGGARFVLIEPDTLVTLDLPLAALGTDVRLLASGVGDLDGPAEAMLPLTGASVAPPRPVGLNWTATADGGAEVRWTRRSRAGWRWADGGDAPLGEEREQYRVVADARETLTAIPALTLSAAERAEPVTVVVRQLSTLAESAPAAITIPPA